MIKTSKLKNGLTLITESRSGDSVTVLAGVNIGSVDEKKHEHGLAHFFEHMCFKGTKTLDTPQKLLSQIDSLGAIANAFTSHEQTAYHLTANKQHFKKMASLVSDMFINSTFSEEELKKEKGVIVQEINMYDDLPMSIAEHNLVKIMFKGNEIERHLAGTEKEVMSHTRQHFVDFYKKHYIAENSAVVVVGDLKHSDVKKVIEEKFRDIPKGKKKVVVKNNKVNKGLQKIEYKKDINQTKLVIGFRELKQRNDKVGEVVSSLLTGGFSSILFIELREKRGACYVINTDYGGISDNALFEVVSGIDHKRLEEVSSVILEELNKLKKGVSEKELKRAKNMLIGRLTIGFESSHKAAANHFDEWAMKGGATSLTEYKKLINAVTEKDIKNFAKKVFTKDNLFFSVVGAKMKDERFKEIAKNLDK